MRPVSPNSASAAATAAVMCLAACPFEAGLYPHIDQLLRVEDQIGAHFLQRQPVALQCSQHLQAGDDAVSGGVMIQADDVAGVFAAQCPALFVQHFQHIAVAHLGPRKGDAEACQGMLEAEIAHQGADHARYGFPAELRGLGDHVEDLVAVVHVTVGINHDDAVAVAVQGDAHVGAALQDSVADALGRRGADLVVDVHAVGLGAHHEELGPQLMEDLGGHHVGGAVGAVERDLHAAQIELVGEGALAELHVAPPGVVDPPRLAELGGRFAAHGLVEAGLDLQLHRVGELGARCSEELDPVVFKRVVGRRNDDAHLQAQGAGQVGNGGRGQRAGQVDVDPRG
jgi:hypothetical protein